MMLVGCNILESSLAAVQPTYDAEAWASRMYHMRCLSRKDIEHVCKLQS